MVRASVCILSLIFLGSCWFLVSAAAAVESVLRQPIAMAALREPGEPG